MATGVITSKRDQTPEDRMAGIISSPAVCNALMKVLPKNLSAERLVRQAVTLIRGNAKLALCPPESVLIGIARAAELGLELSGPLGHCYLIPRWNGKRKCEEAVFQLGQKGYKLMAYRGGHVVMMRDAVVWPGDEFDFEYGSKQYLRHKPCGKEEGEPSHFYAWARMKNGGEDFHVLTMEAMRLWRERYSPAPAGRVDYSGWATNFHGMARKTVVGILSRRMPMSSFEGEIVQASGEDGEYRELPIPAVAQQMLTDIPAEPAGDGPPPVADESAEQPA